VAILVLILLGAIFGWMASILTRTEEPRDVLQQVGLGIAATLLVGLLVNSGTFLGGLTLLALGAGLLAGILSLAAYHLVIRPRLKA
jgi:uncharacterized membrane protein YeaQ/YmgE (transglycosylase-associated protein family)